MTPEQWRQVDDLFAAVSEQPDPDRAIALLADCPDAVVRAEVESLLGHVTDGDKLSGVVAAAAATLGASQHLGRRIGPYKLVGQLGEGGMGVVYAAERDDAEFKRTVAIKILQHGFGSQAAIARFRDERQILATLEHPGIVRLLDGGTTEDGSPYLVMERVDGVPLTKYATDHELSIRDRIELVGRVCAALQYAHARLVVHRDIKPSNILVTADGQPKLLDFGIAKLLDEGAEREAKTGTGVGLLTPAYASPEQARAEPITVATDVYSVGAVLYELLTAKLPLRIEGSPLEVLRTICEVDPQRPSAHQRELAGDLDNIVMKALAKDPKRRYPSIEALADDLQRYLDGQPVLAREATFGYRAGKFVRRHRGKLALAAIAVSALTAAALISIVQARRADEEAQRAEAERNRAQSQLESSYEETGRRALLDGKPSEALLYLNAAYQLGARSPALDFMIARAVESVVATMTVDHGAPLRYVQFSRDGRRLLTAGGDGVARVWEVPSGRQVMDFHAAKGNLAAQFSADGSHVVTKDSTGRIALWRVADGKLERELAGLPQSHPFITFSPSGRLLVDVSGESWVVETGAQMVKPLTKDADASVDVSNDERYLVISEGDVGKIVDLRSNNAVELHGHTRTIRYARFSRDGKRVVTSSLDGTARIWDVATGLVVATLVGHEQRVTDAVFAPDGSTVITTSADRTARLWDASTGLVRFVLRGHNGQVNHAVFAPDSRSVITIGADGMALMFDTRDGVRTASYAHGGFLVDVAFSPTAHRIATASSSGTARVWSSANQRRIATRTWPSRTSRFSFGGERVLRLSDRDAELWDASTGELVALQFREPTSGSVSRTGNTIAVGGKQGLVEVFSGNGVSRWRVNAHARGVAVMTFDSLGRRLVSSDDEGNIRLWDVTKGTELARVHLNRHVDQVAFSGEDGFVIVSGRGTPRGTVMTADRLAPVADVGIKDWFEIKPAFDDRMFAGSPGDTTYSVWSTEGRLVQILGHDALVNALAWSPRRDVVATGAIDGTTSLWSTATWQPHRFRAHDNYVSELAFSRDGSFLATISGDRTARIWEPTTARELFAFPVAEESVLYATFADAQLTIIGETTMASWRTTVEHPTPTELDRLTRCHIPLKLENGLSFVSPTNCE